MTASASPHSSPVLSQRRAGVLLHPTSLPGEEPAGNFGDDAFRFIDFLVEAGISLWQVLPLGPTLGDLSPYMSHSVHAGNPRLISLKTLARNGWLPCQPSYFDDSPGFLEAMLREARMGFEANGGFDDKKEYREFRKRHHLWLEDYALYQALRQVHGNHSWTTWPEDLRDRDPEALHRARNQFADTIEEVRFEQFLFFRQWLAIRRYANERGVYLFGDMPIFVAHDSAEVWAHREYFALDHRGEPITVAGVPPDYFSATGQRWGNPHYRWQRMAADGYRWWIDRLGTAFELYDMVRIDHFRGFEAYWEIPVDEQTAQNGHWAPGPGDALFEALQAAYPQLPLVAEDLGVITPEVEQLRDRYHLPGMKILQFAFDGSPDNPYLPENHVPNCVVYTGTHDNDTTLGWYRGLDEAMKANVRRQLGISGEDHMPWDLIEVALASPAQAAIVPMQDFLALGSEARMNTPGVAGENWVWRFHWEQLEPGLAQKIAALVQRYQRINP